MLSKLCRHTPMISVEFLPRSALIFFPWASMLIISAALLLTSCESSQGYLDHSSRKSDLERIADQLQKTYNVAGISAAIAFDDGSTLSYNTGYADPFLAIEMEDDTLLLAGSIGKTFVSALAFSLADQDKLSLQDSVEYWLGDEQWVKNLPYAHNITIDQLLRHKSGIPNHLQLPEMLELYRDFFTKTPDEPPIPREVLTRMSDIAVFSRPGEDFVYSDFNYLILGLILETAGGEPYYRQIENSFLSPLMLDQIVAQKGPSIPGLASGHLHDENPLGVRSPTVVDGVLLYDPAFEWTGGGFASTPTDLARWIQLLFSGKVLPNGSIEEILKEATVRGDGSDEYGAGAAIYHQFKFKAFGHSGSMPGYRALSVYFPNCGFAIAVEINDERQSGNVRVPLITETLEILLDHDNTACQKISG